LFSEYKNLRNMAFRYVLVAARASCRQCEVKEVDQGHETGPRDKKEATELTLFLTLTYPVKVISIQCSPTYGTAMLLRFPGIEPEAQR
jgi:hypothetical protein